MKPEGLFLDYIRDNFKVSANDSGLCIDDKASGIISKVVFLEKIHNIFIGKKTKRSKDSALLRDLALGWFVGERDIIYKDGYTHLCTWFEVTLGDRNWQVIDKNTRNVVSMGQIRKSMNEALNDNYTEVVLSHIFDEWHQEETINFAEREMGMQ